VAENFSSFLDLLAKNPSWSKFLDDMGSGKAPMKYMIAIERGLREYHTDKFAMGERPLRSRERWLNVSKWRKCEAYITLVRYIRNKITYPKWHDFRYADLQERQTLHQTYTTRHGHIWDSDNDPFNGLLKHPWDNKNKSVDTPPKKKPRKVNPKVKKEKEKGSLPAPPPLMKFNKDGTFSEYMDLTI